MNTDLLEEINLAYKTHGLRPIQGFFYIRRENHNFACPLAALAIHRGIMVGIDPGFEFPGGAIDAGSIETVEWAVETFGDAWVKGFLDGFDRQSGRTEIAPDPEYLQGYDLGVALADQILPRELALGL